MELREWHLPAVRSGYEELARQAEAEILCYERYLLNLCDRACQERRQRKIERLLRQSNLPLETLVVRFECVASASDCKLAVGSEGDRPGFPSFMGDKNMQFFARFRFPIARRAVAGTRKGPLAIRGKCQVPNRRILSSEFRSPSFPGKLLQEHKLGLRHISGC